MSNIAHSDSKLNFLRLFAFGAMGYYVYRVHQKEGTLGGISASGKPIRLNPDAIIESVMPFVAVGPEHKEILSLAGKNLLRGFLKEKGLAE